MILHLQEATTKFNIFRATRNKSAKTVIKILDEVFHEYGFPQVLKTDNGREFTNTRLHRYLNSHGIRFITTSVYHPQANPAERTHREVRHMLRCALQSNKQHWDRILPDIQLAINCLENEVLGESPFHLMFGFQGNTSLDRKWTPSTPLSDIVKIISGGSKMKHKYQEEIRDCLESLHYAAKDKLDRQARYYNKCHRAVKYQVGDVVQHRVHPLSNKGIGKVASLESRFSEPCEIFEVVGPNSYRLKLITSDKAYQTTHDVSELRIHNRNVDGYFSSSEVSIQEEYDPDKIEGLYKELEFVDDEVELSKKDDNMMRARCEESGLNIETETNGEQENNSNPIEVQQRESEDKMMRATRDAQYAPSSSDTEPDPNEPISHRTRQKTNRRLAKIKINNVNFGCIHCSQYQGDICTQHEGSFISLHCINCTDLYHEMMIDFSMDIDDSSLCYDCKRTMHVWRCFGPIITPKCFPCAWDGLQTNWPYNGDVESRAVCSIEATEKLSGGNSSIVVVSFRWNCPVCYALMIQQEKSHIENEWPSMMSYHCPDCTEHMHGVIAEVVKRFNLQTNSDDAVNHDYICTGCSPAVYFMGGMVHADSPNTYTKLKQFDARMINRGFKEGVALSSKLPGDVVALIVDDLKTDRAERMKLLTETRLYDCECNYCNVFPDFKAFALNDTNDLNKELAVLHRDKVFERSDQILRCNRLWAYYQLLLPFSEKNKRYIEREVRLQVH